MATATLISISEYFSTDYEPDADYVDGMIEERNLGELDHAKLQRVILLLLSTEESEVYFECVPELRVRVSDQRVRIPDVCLIRSTAPEEQVLLTPPLLCIEVLSPKDTMPRTMVRVRDFLGMGVPEVWIFDPARRTVHLCTSSAVTLRTSGMLQVVETPVNLSIEDVFAALDKKRRG